MLASVHSSIWFFQKAESRRIGLTIEEVDIVLADEEVRAEAGVPDRVRTVHRLVTVDRDGDRCRSAERAADRVAQSDVEGFRSFPEGVVDNEDGDSFRCLACLEADRSERRQIV